MPTAKPDILQGWKEIAQHVSRDVRTVKRWERQRGFPVRRMPGEGRTNVYVLRTELDAWLSHPAGSANTVEAPNAPANQAEVEPHETSTFVLRPPHVVATAVCLLAALILVVAYRVRLRSQPTSTPDAGQFDKQTTSVSKYVATSVPDVETLYRSGVYSYEQRTPSSLLQAEQFLREAAEKDADYAPAHAGLSITYNLLRQYGSLTSTEAYAKARIEAERAIELDPKSSDAHASLGFVTFFSEWKCAEAETQFKLAIELNPNSAVARQWYGSMLMHEGRFPEAVQQFDVAQRLDPGSTTVLENRALALGQIEAQRKDAVNFLELIPKQDPTFAAVHLRLANLAYLHPRNVNAYLAEKEVWASAAHDTESLANVRAMRRVYETRGERAMWHFEIERLRATINASGNPITPGQRILLADFESAGGNNDAAFNELDLLARLHANEIIGINLMPELEPLHSDPRYNAVLATMGLPPLR